MKTRKFEIVCIILTAVLLTATALVKCARADEGLGIDGKPTKYEPGDRFESKEGYTWELLKWVHTREEGCDWVCSDSGCFSVMCYPTYHDYRWRIKIYAFGAEIDAWTDDMWLDGLKKLPDEDSR